MQIQSRFFNPRHAQFSILGMSIVASCAVSSGLAGESKQPSKIAAPTDSAREAAPYPNCVKIFNGVNFDGWEAAPSTWRIVDGADLAVPGAPRASHIRRPTTGASGSFSPRAWIR